MYIKALTYYIEHLHETADDAVVAADVPDQYDWTIRRNEVRRVAQCLRPPALSTGGYLPGLPLLKAALKEARQEGIEEGRKQAQREIAEKLGLIPTLESE